MAYAFFTFLPFYLFTFKMPFYPLNELVVKDTPDAEEEVSYSL